MSCVQFVCALCTMVTLSLGAGPEEVFCRFRLLGLGILLYEIWTRADTPYKGMNNHQVWLEVTNGERSGVFFIVMVQLLRSLLLVRVPPQLPQAMPRRKSSAHAILVCNPTAAGDNVS